MPLHTGIVISATLGNYNANTATMVTDVSKTVDRLIESVLKSDTDVRKGAFPEVDELVQIYCERPDVNSFPFDEKHMGLDTHACVAEYKNMIKW